MINSKTININLNQIKTKKTKMITHKVHREGNSVRDKMKKIILKNLQKDIFQIIKIRILLIKWDRNLLPKCRRNCQKLI